MKYERPGLDDCAKEPIHIIGSIQSIGYLLVLRTKDFQIVQASANAHQLLGCEQDEVLEGYLDDFFNFSFLEYFHEKINLENIDARQSFTFEHQRQKYIFSAHISDGYLVMEIERDRREDRENSYLSYADLVENVSQETESIHDLRQICQHTIERLRPAIGFDRMMVYRFDENNHGEVIAEDMEDGLDSYLGLKFPDTDIPPQARRLYTVNTLRGIHDVEDTPVPVLPVERADDGQPLDMSHCFLRSVSPIHIEYLRNMGVRASFSISLVVKGRLWGMILCHHTKEPIRLDIHQRHSCHFISKLLSQRIGNMQEEERYLNQRSRNRLIRRIMGSYLSEKNLHSIIRNNHQRLLEATRADHYVLVYGREVSHNFEDQPSWIDDLHPLFAGDKVYYNQKLGKLILQEEVAGVLAMNLSDNLKEGLYFFRKGEEREIEWAGKPQDKNEIVDLSPRSSFEKWTEVIRDESRKWHPSELEFASDLRNSVLEHSVLVNMTNQGSDLVATRLQERIQELERANSEMQAELEQLRRSSSSLNLDNEISQEREQLHKVQNMQKLN